MKRTAPGESNAAITYSWSCSVAASPGPAPSSSGEASVASIWNLRLDQFRQLSQRLLPAEIASFGGNNSRHAFLHDVHVSSAGNLRQDNRRLHFARQIRIVTFVCVANPLVRS